MRENGGAHGEPTQPLPDLSHASPARLLALAAALSMGAAISLGITRFAYGVLLPTMRADLSWSYTLAGAMNTANALGYLMGAMVTPPLLKRHGPATLLLWVFYGHYTRPLEALGFVGLVAASIWDFRTKHLACHAHPLEAQKKNTSCP